MTVKKLIYAIPVLLLFINCKSKRVYQKIDFENNYKFNSEIQEKLAKDTVDWKYQISAGEYAMKGDYKNALEQWDIAFPGKPQTIFQKQIDSINSKYQIVPALNYIVKKAKSNQIIIINEAHNNSSHRVFTKNLLQNLYDNGYKNLGLEALSNGKKMDSLLNKRKYPVQKSGYYIKDPQFGNLVRTALKIGYTVFPYERTSDVSGKEREIEQARNIKKIIDQKPDEKLIIHCGFDHVLEGNHKSWGKAMAGRLYEFTGINPLTINQTKNSERSNPKLNNPLLKALNLNEPSVLLNKNGKPLKYIRREAFTDIAVLHPITKYLNGRPNWLFDSRKKDVKIDLKDINISFPVMALAYLKNEDINKAVPTDIIEIQDKNNVGHLALKNGNYNIVINNKLGKSLKFEIKVK
jgi:hypothetical protein